MNQTDLFERIRFKGKPVAHPDSAMVSGQARFTVLTARLLRLEWSETGEFEDRGTYAFPTRCGPTSGWTGRVADGMLILDTGALVLRYKQDSGPFTPENLSITFHFGSNPQAEGAGMPQGGTWRPGLANPLNLRGTRRTLDECAGDAALDEGLISRAGWALFDDSRSVLFDPDDGWPVPRPGHDLQDWYFFGYGHDYRSALAEYTRFGGQIPLMPRYTLGAWWSRYWAYSDQELKDLVNGFSAHDLPLDVLVVDMDWHTPYAWTGYTWNRELFPDPAAFLRWMHERGLRVTLNLHPAQGIQPFEEIYPRFAQAMGIDPASGEAISFRIADRRFVQHYFELLHHPLEDGGVDFWWMDWQQGESSEVRGLDPLLWLNHLHFRDSSRRGRRPMLYSRWGGLGNHRYPIGFSGDTYATWTALQFQPFMTATASNVAYGWWSHDIGGHMGGATEPELFARWVQFGALSPCLRLHGTKDLLTERRPWKYPTEVYQAAREAFHLRYQLLPYIYTMARVAHDTGISLCRPMYYDYPDEDAAYAARYQYCFGDQIVAAPLVFPADPETGLAPADVWVPEGAWIDYQTKEILTGPCWVRLVGDMMRVPMLVKAGAIIPLAPVSPTTDQVPKDHLILSVFPGTSGAFRLYEDDGLTEAYREGQYEWTEIRTGMEDQDTWLVEIAPVEGRCDLLPEQRGYEIRLEGCRFPQRLLVDGVQTSDWIYDPEVLTTTIRLPKRDKRQPATVKAVAEGGISALGLARNREVRQGDVQRLLGDRRLQNAEDMDAILRLDLPGRMDAVARLGGPFARTIEFVTPHEASQQLGRIIVSGPVPAAEPYDLKVTFALFRGGAVERHVIQMQDVAGAQIVDTPFSFDGQVQSMRWEAEIRIRWRGETLVSTYRSTALFPTIHTWQALVHKKDEAQIRLEQVLDGQGYLNPDLPWRAYCQRADLPLANLTEPYIVPLASDYKPWLAAGDALVGYLAATVTSPDERKAVLNFWAQCPVAWYLNGGNVALLPEKPQKAAQPPFFRPTRRSAVLRLRSGENSLVAVSRPSDLIRPSTELPAWRIGGALTTPAGEVMTDLVFGRI